MGILASGTGKVAGESNALLVRLILAEASPELKYRKRGIASWSDLGGILGGSQQ